MAKWTLPDMIPRDLAILAAQEAVALALMEAADAIRAPKFCTEDQAQRAEALHEARHAILSMIPADAMQALEARDARVREAAYREGWSFAYRQFQRTGSVPDPDYKPAAIREGGK